ncbi:MAG: hypothetical protein EHM59_09710 [Betaproteobacteria bacterium]|nr:MAG: hypothetical protein EHM59_09710 [Betaproteobacteria bacterium]
MMRLPLGLLLAAFAVAAPAQDAHLLQQRAAFAYREMQQAERDAEQAIAEAREQAAEAERLRQQAESMSKQSAAAQKRVSAARARALEARKRWETAADALEKLQAPPPAKP